MAEQQLIDYIKKAKQAGQTDGQTRSLLLKNGWTEAEIQDALSATGSAQSKPAVQQPAGQQPPRESQPKVQQPHQQFKPQAQQPAGQQPRQSQDQFTDRFKAVKEQASVGADIQRTKPATQTGSGIQTNSQQTQKPDYRQQTASQPQAQTIQKGVRTSSKRRVLPMVVLIILLVIVFAGAGLAAVLYFNIWSPSWNPFNQSPEKVLENMAANLQNVKSYNTNTTININVKNSGNENYGAVSVGVSGILDQSNPQSPESNVELSFTTTPGNVVPLGDLNSAMSLKFNAIYADNGIYAKFNDISLSGILIDPGVVIGQWLKFDESSASIISQKTDLNINIPDFTSSNFSETLNGLGDISSLASLFSFSEQLDDQVMGGEDSYHYLMVINKDVLKNALNGSISGIYDQTLIPQVKNMYVNMIDTLFDNIGDINMELWVGKKDYLPHGIKIDKTINLNSLIPGLDAILAFKFNAVNSNFNKTVAVQAPQQWQKAENVILPAMDSYIIKSDLSSIGNLAMTNSANDFSNLCYGKLLNGYRTADGTELVRLNNEIMSNNMASRPECFANQQNFCVSTQLSKSSDGSFLCISQTGQIGFVQCLGPDTPCQ